MLMGDRLVTATEIHALEIGSVKAHLNVLHDEDDTKIREYIDDAVASIETEAQIKLCSETRECTFSCFPYRSDCLILPTRPAPSVTSVSYYDTAGVLTVLANCQVVVNGFVTKIYPPIDGSWPMTQGTRAEPVVILYTAGYPEDADAEVTGYAAIPKDLVGALKLLIADRYENKGDDLRARNGLPPAVERVIHRHSTGTPA